MTVKLTSAQNESLADAIGALSDSYADLGEAERALNKAKAKSAEAFLSLRTLLADLDFEARIQFVRDGLLIRWEPTEPSLSVEELDEFAITR